MPANTSPDNIVYPVSTDPVAPLETVFANMANSVQDALDGFRTDFDDFTAERAIQTFRWANTAARTAQAGMVAGDVGYQEDTKVNYIYSGSAWVATTDQAVTLTPGASCTLNAGTKAVKNEYAGRVVVNLNITKSSNYTSGDAIATFPAGSRPSGTVLLAGALTNATLCFVTVNSSGVVNVYFTGTAGATFIGTGTFFI
jgi:hypothetical protein